MTEILNGLIYLHEQGVLHRDLKPQNILYNSDTDMAISDLGLSRQVNSDSTRLTRYGEVFGTQRYISPEQERNSENVDDKTDIYAFGKILEDIVTNFMQNPIPNEQLAYIIGKCTNQYPERRFSNARELKNMLDNVYQNILRLAVNDEIHNNISLMEMGILEFGDIVNLALNIISNSQEDAIEMFFIAISDDDYKKLESTELDLLRELVTKLKQYYTSQMWGFNYTDVIGSRCRKFYDISEDSVIKALFLYIILEVGISHNRYFVMDIGKAMVQNITPSTAETMELYSLLREHPVRLSRLDISEDDLPQILRSCC